MDTENHPFSSSGFQRALQGLLEAMAQRQVEPICASYLALRQRAGETSAEELLEHIERHAGQGARALLLSAFSRRHCFMCRDGTSPCQACKGTGVAEGSACPQCEGLGAEPCLFCMGSAWTDRNEVPAEFRRAVLKHHVAHVQKDVARLVKLSPKAWTSARDLGPGQRVELATWLMRLQGRLASLAASVHDNGHQRVARFGVLASRIEKLLDALRVRDPQPRRIARQ